MKKIIIITILLFVSANAHAQDSIDDLIRIDHSWVQGSYWNPEVLPSWGFLVDVQADTMFGTLYGYQDKNPTFVVFVGKASSEDKLVYEGEVFVVTDPGVSEEVVGSFKWTVANKNATPSAVLDISSNILNVEGLELDRFGFGEIDKIDMLTGGDWNIIRRPGSTSFADHYTITDERSLGDDGITYARVVDLANPDSKGVLGYFPSDDGDYYAMLVEYTDSSNVFYIFYANHTGMYGRYWLVEDRDELLGEGSYFRGVVDNLQQADSAISTDASKHAGTQRSVPNSFSGSSPTQSELRQLETAEFLENNPFSVEALLYNVIYEGYGKIRTKMESSGE